MAARSANGLAAGGIECAASGCLVWELRTEWLTRSRACHPWSFGSSAYTLIGSSEADLSLSQRRVSQT